MKAAVLQGIGKIEDLEKNLIIEDTSLPEISNDEVLIKIRYASLNHRDLWITKGFYAGIRTPAILGSDCSGVIEEIGSGVDNFKKGDEIIVSPSFNWGNNENYQSKTFTILGLPDNGTLAEYITVKSRSVFTKPSYLTMEKASSIPLAGLTAYRSCFTKAGVKNTDKVLITGIGGGVATFALLFCLKAGAKVFVTSGSDEKIQKAILLGAEGGVKYKDENWAEQLKEMSGGKIDVTIDGTGGDTISRSIDICSPGGRIVSYGATLGDVKDFKIRKLFWKQLKLFGSTMGSDKDFMDMLDFMDTNEVKPVIDSVFELDDVHTAFRKMSEAKQLGKIVIKI